MTALEGNQAISLHPAQLSGQRTAIHIQIICQLLSVVGNIKLETARLLGALGEVGNQTPRIVFCAVCCIRRDSWRFFLAQRANRFWIKML